MVNLCHNIIPVGLLQKSLEKYIVMKPNIWHIGDMDIGQNGELFEDAYISPKAES